MKKLLATGLMFIIITLAFSQTTPSWLWTNISGGSGIDEGMAIVTDSYGYSYVTGAFSGTANIGSQTLISIGSSDIFVAKLDRNGNWLWAIRAGGISEDKGLGISLDSGGNIYVTGYFMGTASIGITNLVSNGNEDIFIAKLNPEGNWQWAIKAGGTGTDRGKSVKADDNGNSYVTGLYNNSVYFGPTNLTNNGGGDVFISKIDTNGNWLWSVSAGGGSWDEGFSIDIDNVCDVYATGLISGVALFGTTSLSYSGNLDLFVTKLDTNGNWLWARRAGSQGQDAGNGIALDSNGNCFITGNFGYSVSFGGTTLNTGMDRTDVFVSKLDTDGNWLWTRQAGGGDWDTGTAIAIDNDGNCLVAGMYRESATFGSTNLSAGGWNNDIFAAKLDTVGNWFWAKKAGTTAFDFAHGISIDGADNCYVTGDYNSVNYYNSTGSDIFVGKIGYSEQVEFCATPLSGVVPIIVSFTDQTNFAATSWQWDFDNDGIIDSYLQNPVHSYTQPGIYSVKLIIQSGTTLDSLLKENYITAIEQIHNLNLITNTTLNFGSVYVEEQSEYQKVKFSNSGNVVINISDAHFVTSSSHFEFMDSFRDRILAPGEVDSILVRFSPHAVGALTDTLYAINSSTNNPVLKIRLTGTGLHVLPKQPQNLAVSMSGYDAHLSWDSVTENMHDQAIATDYYFVYISGEPYGQYTLMALTPNLSYTHPFIGLGAGAMFYKVTAVKFYRDDLTARELDSLVRVNLTPGMDEAEVQAILNCFQCNTQD